MAATFSLVVLYGAIEYLVPPIAAHAYRDVYQSTMFQCDHVMREHFIAKKTVEHAPSESSVKNLEAAEVGLLSCQKYDKLRKWLQTLAYRKPNWGLWASKPLRRDQRTFRRFVEIHEIRF